MFFDARCSSAGFVSSAEASVMFGVCRGGHVLGFVGAAPFTPMNISLVDRCAGEGMLDEAAPG